MLNFSNIPNKYFLGKLLRLPLRFIPKSIVVSVIQAPLRGYKWIIGSGINGYWLGSYEYEKVMLFVKIIKEKIKILAVFLI
jgi:hypothetical protein